MKPPRRVLILVVAGAAAGVGLVLFLAARPHHSSASASPDAPHNLSRPYLQRAGSSDDELQVTPQAGSWHTSVRGLLHFSYSWLACDLAGKHCSPLPGLDAKTIAPPQEQRIITLRGLVTATNRAGSTSVSTGDFFYDMAGLAFDELDRGFVRKHVQFDPAQLRKWYGLAPAEDGAGQTIMIPDFGRVHGLRAAAEHFSAHYGLPGVCGLSPSANCFELVVSYAGRRPNDVFRGGEAEASEDVEWAHAIAPRAKIVFVQFEHVATLLAHIEGLENQPSVVSDSWCDPCGRGPSGFARNIVYPFLAATCHAPHLVCVQASGDHGSPGDTPSNSPYVLAVGGSTFQSSPDGVPGKEAPWRFTGQGDTKFPVDRPVWQRNVDAGCSPAGGAHACSARAVPDVSATAASVRVFTPTDIGHGANTSWIHFEGTSLSTPLWAALIALTDQQLQAAGQPGVGIDELHQVLYRGDVGGSLDDIAPHGWDWKTGLGSPKNGIVPRLVAAIEHYRADG